MGVETQGKGRQSLTMTIRLDCNASEIEIYTLIHTILIVMQY